ncbi:4Fe-4S dicluster domain-containing protein [Desulfolithobacter sp.]
MKQYSAYVLKYGKGADPVFSSVPAPQYPNTPFTCPGHEGRDILLAGGFPAIHPDSPYPLSPTLQLNGDLGKYSQAELTTLARAELTRQSSQSFRSYTLESDPRVAVLAPRASSLREFVDRYGGVLEIEPLLTRGRDPDFVTVDDLELRSTGRENHLSFRVRNPIDPQKCTYCGECGPVCPEHCLSERLFLDLDRCSFCGECVTICPQAAIDLHGAEQRELTVPAVLLLEDTGIPRPQKTDTIFTEEELDQLFASIYAVQVEEVVGFDRSICQYSSKTGGGCTACLTACGHNAISIQEGTVHVDHLLCEECGDCLAACPTGSLQYRRFSDREFVEYFSSIELRPGTTIVVGTEQELHSFWWQNRNQRREKVFFLEYPRVEALSAMHFLYLMARGAGRILLLGVETGSARPLADQIELTNRVAALLPESSVLIQCTSAAELPNLLKLPASARCSLYRAPGFINRRHKLTGLLHFLVMEHGLDATLEVPPFARFGRVVCDQDRCTHCLACLGECHIEALSADSGSFTINHLPALCVQCNGCVQVCPEKALSRAPGLNLRPGFFQSEELTRAEPLVCSLCGKVFGTRKSFKKVMAVLRSRDLLEDNNLLEYCEDCRVIKLYEQGSQ